FDALHQAMVVTDSEENVIYQIPLAGGETGGETQILYRYTSLANKPSFDGVAVAPDGTVYVTALEQNGVATLRNNELVYLAGSFRGPSSLALAPDNQHFYVTNFDSTPLVVPEIRPQLPFALDVVTLNAVSPTPTTE
ncbi:MAG TPA: hypothetical protein VHL11_05120, partial [Phototrophicaceae bacterium]|nr:hypothetical protein [Phototrophicaceae bacterium]